MHYSLCDLISDLTQNSVEAGADLVTLDIAENRDTLTVTLVDNGKGMDEETLRRAEDPFFTDGKKHPGRKVGLGIPFLIQTIECTGGQWKITSAAGKGTRVYVEFNLADIDIPVTGNMCDLFVQIMTLPGNYHMEIHRTKENPVLDYRLNRGEIQDALGSKLETAESIKLLRLYVDSLEEPH